MNEEDRDGLRGSVDSVETRSGTGTDGGESPVSRTMARRTFLTVTAAAGTAGLAATGCGWIGSGVGDVGGYGSGGGDDVGGGSTDPDSVAADLKDNIYTRLLGVRPHIGAHEHLSSTGGSRMPPEVIEAMAEANRSAGAFASMLTGADEDRMEALPNPTWPKVRGRGRITKRPFRTERPCWWVWPT